MSTGLVLQHSAVAVAVAVSVAYVAQSRFPHAMRALRLALAARLLRGANRRWSRTLAARIAPRPRAASECGGCNGCAATEPTDPRA